jgi:hypothetical protein
MQVDGDENLNIAFDILALPPEYAPDIACMREGLDMFRESYSHRVNHQSALRFLTARGAQLWRERQEAATLDETPADQEDESEDMDTGTEESGKEHIWTPQAVVTSIENMLLHSAHLIRRARWFCLLSESSLTWSSAGDHDNFKMFLTFENGTICGRDRIKAGTRIPTPPGYATPFRSRQNNIDLITYDRLRVLTTELRRLVSEGRDIELRLGPEVTLNRRAVMNALRWV